MFRGARRALHFAGVNLIAFLRSIPGYFASWPMQELTGLVALADNVAITAPDTKQLALLTYGDYTAGAGWSNSGTEVALHTAGDVATLAQAGLLGVGKTYVLTTIISGRTAGTVTPTGGTAISASTTAQAITATGTALVYTPTTDFDGSIDLALVVLKQTGILDSGAYPGAEELSNGDMEAGTTDWLANNAALAEETGVVHSGTKSLKVTRGGANPSGYQTLTGVLGQTISVDSWGYIPTAGAATTISARIGTSPGGSEIATITSTTKDTWVNLVTKGIATADTVYISFALVGVGAEYVYFDDCSAKVTNPLDGTYVGVTLAQPGAGNIPYMPFFDATTSYLNFYSAEVNSAIDFGGAGTLIAFGQVFNAGVWIDGVARHMVTLETDTGDKVFIRKSAVNNSIEVNYKAGGVSESIVAAVSPTTGLFSIAITWDTSGAGEVKAYFKAVQVGATQTIAGVFSGNLISTGCVVGANSTTPNFVWHGYEAYTPVIATVALPQTTIAQINAAFGVA